ncbi:aspartate aminotransferase family protein [Sphingomonas sp.]|uniref:aspartate aminotransferase family protein n=1 Tax=Sphingomonas sp. TaxID=28214 RepID=UPI002DD64592|nr:aminotransferase class III-fold pyridoxal phosphate-dependent enzyme [Sphingomonas sp.]
MSSNFRLGIRPTPLVIERGEGPYLIDADGNRLIDYYLGMGPMILGHDPDAVIEAARRQLDKGILFAGQTEAEFEAARLVCELVPCAEMVRFGGSGTEVIQAALRLARAVTGRRTVLKFEGHYHGWLDNVHWSVAPPADRCGPREAPARVAGSAGQDPAAGEAIDVLGWNDADALRARLERGDVAAVIMEPLMCNTSAIQPEPGYLEAARAACDATGTLLIFDEVITGFRVSAGGAQARLDITPDLATFGKAIANGFPVAALAGRADLMERFASGGVLHGGTYNAHPVTMAATAAVLRALRDGDVYDRIEAQGRRLMDGIAALLAERGVPARVQGVPAIFHVALGIDTPIRNYRDSMAVDRETYTRLTAALLARGVRALERGAWFLSCEHDAGVIDQTLAAFADALDEVLEPVAG